MKPINYKIHSFGLDWIYSSTLEVYEKEKKILQNKTSNPILKKLHISKAVVKDMTG